MKKIVKVSASWCVPCRSLKPVWERVKDDFESEDLRFVTINDEEDETLFDEFSVQYRVKTVPTIFCLDENGEVLDKIIGSISEQQLRTFINKNIQ